MWSAAKNLKKEKEMAGTYHTSVMLKNTKVERYGTHFYVATNVLRRRMVHMPLAWIVSRKIMRILVTKPHLNRVDWSKKPAPGALAVKPRANLSAIGNLGKINNKNL